jgi:CHAT domain-containing protein/Flp pilus assembly protein TadD
LHGSDVERGTRALIEVFSKQRLIEPRLSGGFKCGRLNASSDASLDVSSDTFARAQELISDAVAKNEPGAELAYGRLLVSRGEKLREAEKYLHRAVEISSGSSEAHNDLGVCLLQTGKIEQAVEEFEAALENRAEMPEALFNRALCYQRLLLKDAARADLSRLASVEHDNIWLNEIKQRLDEVSAPLVTPQSLPQIAGAFDTVVAQGDIDAARMLADQNSEILIRHAIWSLSVRQLKASISGNQPDAAQALSGLDLLGNVLIESRGNWLVADVAMYLRQLPAEKRQSELDLITSYVETINRFQSNQPGDTLGGFQRLQKQFRDRGNRVFEALSGFQAANYCYAVKRFSDSIMLLKNILLLVEQHQWPYNRAAILNLLALQTSRLGQESLAIKYFQQAVTLCNKSPQLESQILQYMSIPYWRLGDLDTALEHLRGSTRLYLENGQQPRLLANLAHNYSEIADVYRLRDKHALSLLYAREALDYSLRAMDLKYAAEYSSFIALEHARLQQFDEAEVELKHALEYLDQVAPGRERDFTETLVMTNAGEVAVRGGDVSRGLGYYERANALTSRGEGNTLARIDVLRSRAAAHISSGGGEKARSDLLGAVDLIEKYWSQIAAGDQRSHFLDASHSVFDQLISLDSTVLARPSEAFEMSEQARARALLEEIGRDSRPNTQPDLSSPKKAHPLKLKEVQSYLDEDSLVLQYSVTSKGTYLFLITHSDFKLVESPATTEILDRLVRDYISDLRRLADEEDVNEKARVLYDYLISPVKEDIRRKSNLCIVPDKALHFLPFAALVDRSNDSYLIEIPRLNLTYAPSASVLAKCISEDRSSRSARPERILAVGNPLLDNRYFRNLAPLVDAENEAKQSASLYGPGSVVLIGEQATEPKVRQAISDCDVAHLALHCLVEEGSPWLSALVLAGAKPTGGPSPSVEGTVPLPNPTNATSRDAALSLPQEPRADSNDGVLYLNELYGLRLPHTRIVVLSACQSGLGQYYRGEGIVSLVRPFLTSGVPTVVASLWPVDSRATSELMIAFHTRRKLDNRKTGEALHDAQLKLIQSEQFRHPIYWAAFIVVGANN